MTACTQQAGLGAAERSTNHIYVGVIGSLCPDTPEPVMQAMLRPFKSLLETQTGLSGQLVIGRDAISLSRKLKDDSVQLAVFHGVEFAWARAKNPGLKPLLICVNQHHVLHAYLVVRKDLKASSPADLEGKTLALPQQSREHCRLFLERRCVRPGSDPRHFFASISNSADLEEALDDVVDGRVQAAVVDSCALAAYRRLKPGCADQLRTLVESEGFPPAVVAYQSGSLSEDMLQRFRDGLLAARSSRRGQQLLEMCRITGFEPVPEDYEQMLTDIAKAYPPPGAEK